MEVRAELVLAQLKAYNDAFKQLSPVLAKQVGGPLRYANLDVRWAGELGHER